MNKALTNKFLLLSLALGLASCAQNASQTVQASQVLQTLAAPLAAAGEPVINEVYYDAPGPDAGTFIELKGPAGKSLSGYTLTAYNTSGSSYATIALSGSIPASGYYLVAQDTGLAANLVNAGTDLFNKSSSLRLSRGSTVVDAMSYGSPGSNLGEGSSASTVTAGSSLARTPDGQDTGNNSADFAGATPSAGASNGGDGGGNPNPPPPPPPNPGGARKVLFDLTKHEDAGNSDWRIDGAYSDYGDALKALGYTVGTLSGGSITAASLSGVKVLVIPEPQNPFSDSERAVLISFVQGGGGLFMIGDHRTSDRDNDGWDSPEVFDGWDGSTPASPAANLRKSLDARNSFGLSFSFASKFSDPVYTARPTNTNHPVVVGSAGSSDDVSSAGVYVGTSIDLAGASSVMGNAGKIYLAVNTLGTGRVAAWGDSSAFEDATLSSGGTGKFSNWGNLSNANLGKNVVRWLAGDL
jgi:hypothetical protein